MSELKLKQKFVGTVSKSVGSCQTSASASKEKQKGGSSPPSFELSTLERERGIYP
jgi:hypothetical protein